MGYYSLVPHFGSLFCTPTLPPCQNPCNRIEPLAELIPDEPVFLLQYFIPCDFGIIDLLQLNHDRAGLVGVELRRKFAERGIANRLTRESYESIDDESAPAHLVSEADGVEVTLRGIRIPFFDFCQLALICKEMGEYFQTSQLGPQTRNICHRRIRRHQAITSKAKPE